MNQPLETLNAHLCTAHMASGHNYSGAEALAVKAEGTFLKATKPTTTLKGATSVSSNNATKGLL